MSTDIFKYLVNKLGVSKATVSKTLLHRSGVDSEMRRYILEEYKKLGIHEEGECDIYTILPDTPHYFWEQAYLGIQSAATKLPVSVKQNIYTNLVDTDIILDYLNEAECMKAKVIILSAEITSEIHNRIEELQKKCEVFLLCENTDFSNAYYIGTDPQNDGRIMGEFYCENYLNSTPIVLFNKQNYNIRCRTEGFCEVLRKYDPERFRKIDFFEIPGDLRVSKRIYSAKMASLLTTWIPTDVPCVLYIPYGTLSMPLVLQKAKISDHVICLCHDCMLRKDGCLEAGIAANLNQKIYSQGEAALRVAAEYVMNGILPEQKNIYISSEVYFNEQ